MPSLPEAMGYVNYLVTFGLSEGARRRRQSGPECSVSPCDVPVEEGGVVIVGLDEGTAYDLSVTPSNEDGITGTTVMTMAPGSYILLSTVE